MGNALHEKSLIVSIIAGLFVFAAAIVAYFASTESAKIPIRATMTAEARQTELANTINKSPSFDWVFNPVNGHYYKVLPFMCTWQDCEAAAVDEGTHLVTINNEEEQIWLVQTFFPEQYWIGFTDDGDEGKWHWVSGESVSYINWLPGEPSNYAGIEQFAEIDIREPNNGKWNDDKNAELQWAIIENTQP